MKLLGTELTFNNNEIWHKGNLDPSIFRVKQNKYVTTTAGTADYYRVATIPMSSIFKNTIFKVKAYTPTGTTTESTIIVDIAYYAGNYSSQAAAVSALTSHSYDSDTTAENGWVLRYCRVSFDADYGYIDLYVRKNSVVTIEIEPLVESDWIWATGNLTANPAVGSLKNVSVTMAAGFRASNIVATSATSATYSNYGTLGTTTISDTTDKTGQWAYFGYFTISYNASYLRGHCANIRVRLQEINHDGTKNLADLDDFVLILKASMPYHANSTEFNTKVPSIHIEIEGKTSISPNDVAGLVYSTSTSTKTIRFYIRLKEANTVYQINPEQRYGRSFATSSYSATTSYFSFTYAGTQTPVTSLPTPAQGSIVYAVKRTIDADTLNGNFAEDFALRNHTHTIANITNLQSTLDAKAPLASPNFTGTPTAPTAPNGTNTNQIATTAFVQNALSAGGYGDMLKSQYDTDSDGIVDRAETADKLTTARTISLSGDVTGSASFDGSGNISINATVVNDSHNHTISNITNLQTSLDSKINKTGDTITGALISDVDIGIGDTRVYKNVVSYKNASSSVTGTIKIALPKTWSNTMMRIHIKGYDFTSNSAWELVIGGYNYSSIPAWMNYSAELRGNAPFSQVRLGHDGSKCCILLGTISSVWGYPHIVVEEVIAGHSTVTGWETGWTISVITDETGISYIVTPTLRKMWHSENDGSGSGMDADLLDGKHAGNSSNQIPISNGILCSNLNAERVNGTKITVGTTSPTSPSVNDIWIDTNS